MRKFYIFKVKKEYQNLYQKKPANLDYILKYLYYLKPGESNCGIELFFQLIQMIDKNELNRKIFIKYHNKKVYSKVRELHIINDLYSDEISTLKIKSSYILLESKYNTSSFFYILLKESDAFFICDFENQDYFWLSEVKTLV